MDLDQQQFVLPEAVSHEPAPGTEVIEDGSFSYDGYEVVRGEFFSHIYSWLTPRRKKWSYFLVRKIPKTAMPGVPATASASPERFVASCSLPSCLT